MQFLISHRGQASVREARSSGPHRSDVMFNSDRAVFVAHCPDGSKEEFHWGAHGSLQKAYEAAVDHRINFLPRFAARADEILALMFDDYAARLKKLDRILEDTSTNQEPRSAPAA